VWRGSFVVARYLWQWALAPAAAVTVTFLVPELTFLGSNLVKVPDGARRLASCS